MMSIVLKLTCIQISSRDLVLEVWASGTIKPRPALRRPYVHDNASLHVVFPAEERYYGLHAHLCPRESRPHASHVF